MLDFLKELESYSSNQKAYIVYKKCIKAGKLQLAKKIKIKYNLFNSDDMVDAMSCAIYYLSKNSKKAKKRMTKNQKLIDIAQKMHDTIGANLSAAKMFYSASENYMIEATKEDREAFKRANNLIDESCELLREIYEDLNNL